MDPCYRLYMPHSIHKNEVVPIAQVSRLLLAIYYAEDATIAFICYPFL